MARPGPAPKPAGLRLVEGTDSRGRSGRTLDRTREPVAPDDRPEPPYAMSELVAGIWTQTVDWLVAMKVASSVDAFQIAAYCEAVAIHQRASHTLAADELLVPGYESTVSHKLLIVQERAAATVLRFAQEFGLTPAARMRVEVGGDGDKDKGANPFAG